MIVPLRYTLLTDGSSDRVLLPILNWLLRQHLVNQVLEGQWSNPALLIGHNLSLDDKIRQTLYRYPCRLLFVHRDAETEPRQKRIGEIETAISKISEQLPVPPSICVVPIRMQETWLLIDEVAIRMAANNPRGRVKLHLPAINELEKHSSPKKKLHDLLRDASELGSHRLRKFNPHQQAHRIAEFIEDFSILRQLSAFQALESDVIQVIQTNAWNN
jgi:hypothetical protein